MLCVSLVPKLAVLKQLYFYVSLSLPIVSHPSFSFFSNYVHSFFHLFFNHFISLLTHCSGSFNTTPLFLFLPAIKCPVGSHYEPCGSACPASCQDPGSEGTCSEPCVEGCVCDPGFVLSGDKCVPFSECGCTDRDNNYRPVSSSED